MYFWEMPKLASDKKDLIEARKELVETYEESKSTLKEVKDENSSLKDANDELIKSIKTLQKTFVEKKQEPTVVDNQDSIAEKERAKEEELAQEHENKILAERVAKKEENNEKILQEISEINTYIQKGKRLLSEHLALKPNFKEGKIKTSQSDRDKWYEAREVKEDFYKEEISKLENRKNELTRMLNQ